MQRGQSVHHGQRQVVGDISVQQLVDEPFDAPAQFPGRQLGEGDGGDVPRRDAACEEHRHAACQQRSLAGAGRGLDEQGLIEDGERAPPVGAVGSAVMAAPKWAKSPAAARKAACFLRT